MPKVEKEQKTNEDIAKQMEVGEKAKWERDFNDKQHKKEVAKQIYDGNKDRLGLRNSMVER